MSAECVANSLVFIFVRNLQYTDSLLIQTYSESKLTENGILKHFSVVLNL
jgi:hypothetical protein